MNGVSSPCDDNQGEDGSMNNFEKFFTLFASDEFNEEVDLGRISDKDLLKTISTSDHPLARQIRDDALVKNAKRKENNPDAAPNQTAFKGESSLLQELGTPQMMQNVRSTRATALYVRACPMVKAERRRCIIEDKTPTKFLLTSKYLQLRVSASKGDTSRLPLDVPSNFEARLFFNVMPYVHSRSSTKKRKLAEDPLVLGKKSECGTRLGTGVQYVIRLWDVIAARMMLTSIEQLIEPYMCRNGDGLYVPARNDEEMDPEEARIVEEKIARNLPSDVATSSSYRLRNDVLHLVTCFFEDLHSIVTNNRLYSDDEAVAADLLRQFNTRKNRTPTRITKLPQDLLHRVGYKPYSSLRPKTGPAPPASTPRTAAEEDIATARQNVERVRDGTVKRSMKAVRTALQQYVTILNCSYNDLVQTYEQAKGVTLMGQVQFACCDPPYNIRRHRNRPFSDYDRLHPDDMQDVVKVLDDILKDGGHGILFCTSYQFKDWYDALTLYRRESDRATPRSYVTRLRRKGQVFMVEEQAQVFIKKPGTFSSRGYKSFGHTNVYEAAVHFWKPNGRVEEQDSVFYTKQGFIDDPYPRYGNVMGNIPSVVKPEAVYTNEQDGALSSRLRSEQKPEDEVAELIGMYTKRGDTVCDLFSGAFSTARACFRFADPRTFVGCELDQLCMQPASRHILRAFMEATLREDNRIAVSDELKDHIKVVYRAMQLSYKAASATTTVWKVPHNADATQKFPPHVVDGIGILLENPTFAVKHLETPPDKYPLGILGRFDGLDPKSLLAIENVYTSTVIAKSTILHPKSGKGLFTTQALGPNQVVGYFYGTLVYGDLSNERRSSGRVYGGGLMAVTAKDFMRYSMATGVKFRHRPGEPEMMCYIVPPSFCSTRYINDASYLDGDPEKNAAPEQRQDRAVNVRFERRSTASKVTIRQYDYITVRAIRNIDTGEELFCSYGEDHAMFHEDGQDVHEEDEEISEQSDYAHEEDEQSNHSSDESEEE